MKGRLGNKASFCRVCLSSLCEAGILTTRVLRLGFILGPVEGVSLTTIMLGHVGLFAGVAL